MATTSPDNIRTPDSGDAYNLVPDLATLAGDVQAALTRRANSYIGTTAQMNATAAPNGTQWYNTTTNTEYLRQGGTWVVTDSGFVNCALGTMVSAGFARVRRHGSIVTLSAVLTTTTLSSGTNYEPLITVPAGYIPAYSGIPLAAWTNWSDISPFAILHGMGVVQFRFYGTASPTQVRLSGAWSVN